MIIACLYSLLGGLLGVSVVTLHYLWMNRATALSTSHQTVNLLIALLWQHVTLWLAWSSAGCLLCLVASIDGYGQRLIRRWSGGRESLAVHRFCHQLAATTVTVASCASFISTTTRTLSVAIVIGLYTIAAIAIQQYNHTVRKYL